MMKVNAAKATKRAIHDQWASPCDSYVMSDVESLGIPRVSDIT